MNGLCIYVSFLLIGHPIELIGKATINLNGNAGIFSFESIYFGWHIQISSQLIQMTRIFVAVYFNWHCHLHHLAQILLGISFDSNFIPFYNCSYTLRDFLPFPLPVPPALRVVLLNGSSLGLKLSFSKFVCSVSGSRSGGFEVEAYEPAAQAEMAGVVLLSTAVYGGLR